MTESLIIPIFRKKQRIRVSLSRPIGMLLGLLSALGFTKRSDAQISLTVRPQAMATATRTDSAGKQTLGSIGDAWIYVPAQCVGAQRCPLVVDVDQASKGGAVDDSAETWQRRLADDYGMLLLFAPRDDKYVGTALVHALQRYAVDPQKIAVIGREGAAWGQKNLKVFSRIVSTRYRPPPEYFLPQPVPRVTRIVGDDDRYSVAPPSPRSPTTQFLFVGGLGEYSYLPATLGYVHQLREAGHPVEHVVSFRGHRQSTEDYALMWRWLHETWRPAEPAGPPAPSPVADSIPRLTPEALAKLTAFWTRFQQAPESIRTTARRAHQRQIVVPVGRERVPVKFSMMDVAALAARYPTVAAALAETGLTARQAETYRIALVAASVTRLGMAPSGSPTEKPITLPSTMSVLGYNLVFMSAHRKALKALGATGMWVTP